MSLRPNGQFNWTEETEKLVVELREDEGMEWAQVSAEIPGTSAGGCRAAYERVRARERAQAGIRLHTFKASPSQLLERDRREQARRLRDETNAARGVVTSYFFGDPEPGRSALDRRRANA